MRKHNCLIAVKLIFLLMFSTQVLAENNELIQLTRKALSLISEHKTEDIKNLEIKDCGINCVSFGSSLSEIQFKLQISSNTPSPYVSSDHTSRTLHLPSLDVLKSPSLPEPLQSALKVLLISHELHPYIKFSKSKPSQDLALRASTSALEQGASSFLHVSPAGMGKTWVLIQTLLKQMREFSNRGKVFIVTAYHLQLIHQLFPQLKIEQNTRKDFHIVNWMNIREKNWQSFASEMKKASERNESTVLVIPSLSLQKRLIEFFAQTEKNYQDIQHSFLNNLAGIYMDGAHHLGAHKTGSSILDLVQRSEAFLYGATATPVHLAVNLRDFFEREHWTYLNTEENLFAEHDIESITEQLAIGIYKGELTPFDDLYIIGEKSFEDLAKDQSPEQEPPVFIQAESSFYVLNPDHYNSLLHIIGPILLSNQKGFIVTATIAEAERLEEFLNNNTTGIQFEAYHSRMSGEERRKVLERSKSSRGTHYIIAVKSLDEGVDLPHLSAYIDLNFNVSIKQMIHRIGKVLRLYPGKQNADILFLLNYRNEQFAKDALSLLENMEKLSFSAEKGREESGDANLKFEDSGIKPMSRTELEEMTNRLPEHIRKFWSNRYPLEEIPGAVARLNENSSKDEQITSERAYKEFHLKDPRLPSWDSIKIQYRKEYGSYRGLSAFVLSESNFIQLYTLDEVPEAVARLNANSPKENQIKSVNTYREFYHRDPRLPPWHTLGMWFIEEYGNKKGLLNFVLNKGRTYTLDEIPGAVARLNEKSSTEEQITSINTYKKFYHKDSRLFSFESVSIRYEKKYGTKSGAIEFVLTGKKSEPKPNIEFYTLEEIPAAVARLNANSPTEEQITSKTTYENFRYKDSKLPSWSAASKWFLKEYGSRQGFSDFMFRKTTTKSYTLEEIPAAVARLNANSPTEEQITSMQTYEDFHQNDPKLPTWDTISEWYKNKYGNRKELLKFILSKTTPPPNRFYTLEEVPAVVTKLNENSPTEEQITSKTTYELFRYKDQKLPRWFTLRNWYIAKHGSQKGMADFILNRTRPETYILTEIPGAVARLNTNSSQTEKITSISTYIKFHHKDTKLPSWAILGTLYEKRYGNKRGLTEFVLSESDLPFNRLYTLEEIPEAIARLNANSPLEKQMISEHTYKQFYRRDQKLPPWDTASGWFAQKHGNRQGFSNFMFGRSCEDIIGNL